MEHCYDYNFIAWKPLQRAQQGAIAHPTPAPPAPAPSGHLHLPCKAQLLGEPPPSPRAERDPGTIRLGCRTSFPQTKTAAVVPDDSDPAAGSAAVRGSRAPSPA